MLYAAAPKLRSILQEITGSATLSFEVKDSTINTVLEHVYLGVAVVNEADREEVKQVATLWGLDKLVEQCAETKKKRTVITVMPSSNGSKTSVKTIAKNSTFPNVVHKANQQDPPSKPKTIISIAKNASAPKVIKQANPVIVRRDDAKAVVLTRSPLKDIPHKKVVTSTKKSTSSGKDTAWRPDELDYSSGSDAQYGDDDYSDYSDSDSVEQAVTSSTPNAELSNASLFVCAKRKAVVFPQMNLVKKRRVIQAVAASSVPKVMRAKLVKSGCRVLNPVSPMNATSLKDSSEPGVGEEASNGVTTSDVTDEHEELLSTVSKVLTNLTETAAISDMPSAESNDDSENDEND